jgi:hypothetical protein
VVYGSGLPKTKVRVGSTVRPESHVAEVGRKIRIVPIPLAVLLNHNALLLQNARQDRLVSLGRKKLKRRSQRNET